MYMHRHSHSMAGQRHQALKMFFLISLTYTMFCEGFITILDLSMPSTQVKNVPTVRTMFKGTKV